MPAHRLTALLPLLLFAACSSQPTEPSSSPTAEPPEQAEPSGPETIAFEPGFEGEPMRVTELGQGITLEAFADGEGEVASEGRRVSFYFSGYDAATGERIMGTQDWPAKLVVGAESRDPVGTVIQDVVEGMQPGARARLRIPAMLVNQPRPDPEIESGDLWITLTVTEVDDPPQPRGLDAYAGEPIASDARGEGLEVHDFAPGDGPEAADGDRVEFHLVVTSPTGEQLFSTHTGKTPVELTLSLDSGVIGLARGLRGARPGMLRKLSVPAELGFDEFAPEPYPRDQATIMYIEVIRVEPGPDR